MTKTIEVDEAIYLEAERCSDDGVTAEQKIAHWIKMGKLLEDNPDLTYSFAEQALVASEEVEQGFVKQCVRRLKRE